MRDADDTETWARASVPALVTAALLRHDLPASTWEERDAAARYVDDSISAMPDVTRLGVRVASGAAYAGLCLMARGSYRKSHEAERARLAARLAAVPLPVLGEFGRLTRGLGLVAAHEARHRSTPARGTEP